RARARLDVVERRGLPVTSALRTTVDLGSHLPTVEAVAAVDMALHSGLIGLPLLHAYIAAHPASRGIARLRTVVDLADPASESPMESRLRLLLVLAGLPRPQAQVPIHHTDG